MTGNLERDFYVAGSEVLLMRIGWGPVENFEVINGENYKRAVAFPLLHSLKTQLKERFSSENNRHTQPLLC